MPVLIQLKNAQKTYGMQVLLDGADVAITDNHKVGLIGRNGCGKSTLCRILLGEEELDHGEVIKHPNLRLGYLKQHDPFEPQETVMEFLERDTGQPDWRCAEMAAQFDIKGAPLTGPVQKLSGGWQTRVKLAALLLHEPELLLLDEPTNFLDLRTQLLLEDFLKGYRGACLVVSHDRTFLKDTCTQTLELARGKLTFFNGNVDAFLEFQKERQEHNERVNAATEVKRRQLKTFIDKNRAGANTASQARSKAKQLESLELIAIDRADSKVRMRVPDVQARQGVALRVEGMTIGYPEHTVAKDIDLEIEHGSRAAVVGDNGQGKTTFLRTIVESIPSLAGSFRWGHACDVGCYAQHVYSSLPGDYTVVEYLGGCSNGSATRQEVLNLAGSFLFRGDDVEKPIKVLSGGERARLCLAGLLLGRHNILVLDEPVNHLDVETVQILADALKRYKGTLIFTSHDRHFMHTVATSVLQVRDERVRTYPGSYDEYLYRVGKEIDEGLVGTKGHEAKGTSNSKGTGKAKAKAPVKEMSREERKALARKRFELQRDLKSAERKAVKYDKLKVELDAKLANVDDPAEAKKLNRELEKVVRTLSAVETDWFKLQKKLEKLDG